MEPLTKNERLVLDAIREKTGGNFFKAYDLPAKIQRPTSVCDALVCKGYLSAQTDAVAVSLIYQLIEG